MSSLQVSNEHSKSDNNEHFLQMINVLWDEKLKILIISILFTTMGLIYSFNLPNIYKAQATLATSEEQSSSNISSIANQFGGLASLAGVNLSSNSLDRTTFALEILQSRVFINDFIKKRKLEPFIIAAESWDDGEIKFNDKIYNPNTNEWNKKNFGNDENYPSEWKLYKDFKLIFKVVRDKTTGLIYLSAEHISPVIAKNIVDWLIFDLNEHVRNVEINEAKNSVDFLNKELSNTPVADMQSMFYKLIEKQYQIIMLANVREQYILKVIDPAVIPEEKSRPQKLLIVIFFAITGFLLAVSWILILNSNRK